jgi:hypothetical protein
MAPLLDAQQCDVTRCSTTLGTDQSPKERPIKANDKRVGAAIYSGVVVTPPSATGVVRMAPSRIEYRGLNVRGNDDVEAR